MPNSKPSRMSPRQAGDGIQCCMCLPAASSYGSRPPAWPSVKDPGKPFRAVGRAAFVTTFVTNRVTSLSPVFDVIMDFSRHLLSTIVHDCQIVTVCGLTFCIRK